jgi:hypothetical protein
MSRSEGKKAAARSGNYQDNVTRPLSRDQDDNGVDPDAMDDLDADGDPDTDPAVHVLPAVERVSAGALHVIPQTEALFLSSEKS